MTGTTFFNAQGIEVTEKENAVIEASIWGDVDGNDPRSWDNIGTMICAHRKYNLGDIDVRSTEEVIQKIIDTFIAQIFAHGKHAGKDMTTITRRLSLLSERLENGSVTEEQALENLNAYGVILPLYLFDHSGLSISTSSFNDHWDSGQVGFIVVSKWKAIYEYGNKQYTKEIQDKVEKYLTGEVKTYDQYLKGEVYGYTVTSLIDSQEDTCGGYYDDDAVTEEAMGSVKAIVRRFAEKDSLMSAEMEEAGYLQESAV